ncbi:MAG: Flp family type IVb pilin [Myxococcales bacterium]|nr:Flp family type IVb pilin [Myxococcales bacterium]
MLALLKKLWKNESGLSATEYAVLAAVMVGALVGAFALLKPKINNAFTNAGNQIENATQSGSN